MYILHLEASSHVYILHLFSMFEYWSPCQVVLPKQIKDSKYKSQRFLCTLAHPGNSSLLIRASMRRSCSYWQSTSRTVYSSNTASCRLVSAPQAYWLIHTFQARAYHKKLCDELWHQRLLVVEAPGLSCTYSLSVTCLAVPFVCVYLDDVETAPIKAYTRPHVFMYANRDKCVYICL